MTNAFSKEQVFAQAPRTWKTNMCYWNAEANQHLFGKQLRIVYGSLGLNGHYEFGGRDYKLADFKRKWNDSHAWLEDEDGNVYDYLFSWYATCAETWGKQVTFPINHELCGVSKRDLLRRYKLSYIPADAESQLFIQAKANAARPGEFARTAACSIM